MPRSNARTWSASALFATFVASPLRRRSQRAIPTSAGVGPQATGRSRATRAVRSSAESPARCANTAAPLEVGLALAGPAEHEAGHPDLPVRPREVGEVIGGLQCRGDLECLAELVLDLRRGVDPRTDAHEIEARVRLDSLVSDSLRLLDRRAEDVLRSLELAAPREGIGELGQRLEPPRIVGRKEVDATLQEAHGCGDVGTSSGTRAGRQEPDRGTRAELVGVGLSELATEQIRLLEVVAEDLVALEARILRGALEPAGIRLVELRSQLFRHRPVGRFADQQMTEAVCVLAGEKRGLGPDQLLANEARELHLESGTHVRGHEFRDRPAVEHLPLDRARAR